MNTAKFPDDARQALISQVSRWPGECAAGLVTSSGLWSFAGPVDQPFRWASVSKLLVASACMVAAEEGTVSLDERAGPAGSTLAHLLAHASGLPHKGHVPVARPASQRIYSNTGTEVAADLLEQKAGMSFGAYLSGGVLGPLGMLETALEGSPAHGARGPLSDLLRLGRELLSPTIVSNATLKRASSVAWPGLAGVVPGFGWQNPCDWGLGPEVKGDKSPHWTGSANSPSTFGHFGRSGSFLWVDPVAGVALASLSTTPFGPWAKQAWPALSDEVLGCFGLAGA